MDDILKAPFDEDKDYYSELVGEGKKYKDNKALAKKAIHSDLHIDMLEKRIDEMRDMYLKKDEELKSRAMVEDFQLQQKQPPTSNTTPPVKEVMDQPKIDLDAIDKRLESKIREFEVVKKQQDNVNQVKKKLAERYGENFQSTVSQQIEYLGLTDEDFNSLARKSPAALLTALGIDAPRERFQAPPGSSNNFTFKGPPKRTWSHYQDMKKKNPKTYLDPKTLTQMEKDALELGDAFYDGDF
jgi:hypothetical protein